MIVLIIAMVNVRRGYMKAWLWIFLKTTKKYKLNMNKNIYIIKVI